MINRLINDRKLIHNGVVILTIFQQIMSKMCWFQLWKCEVLLFLFVLYEGKLNISDH